MKQIKLTVLMLFISIASISTKAKDSLQTLPVQQISDSVYSIVSPHYGLPSKENQGWNSNSHFVVTGDGVLVIDSGSSEKIGKKIIKTIRTVTEQPIRWLVNSHSHADHWLGNAPFKHINAEIISSKASVKEMQADGDFVVKAFNRMTEGETGESEIVFPITQLTEKQSRVLGQLQVELIFAENGHSPGDLLVWLPQESVIIGGDVFSSDWMPIMTHHGHLPGLLNTLSMVAQLQPSKVLTGHGRATNSESINRDIEFLETITAQINSGLDQQHSVTDISSNISQKLTENYSSQYRDFESNLSYLVETLYQKLKGHS